MATLAASSHGWASSSAYTTYRRRIYPETIEITVIRFYVSYQVLSNFSSFFVDWMEYNVTMSRRVMG